MIRFQYLHCSVTAGRDENNQMGREHRHCDVPPRRHAQQAHGTGQLQHTPKNSTRCIRPFKINEDTTLQENGGDKMYMHKKWIVTEIDSTKIRINIAGKICQLIHSNSREEKFATFLEKFSSQFFGSVLFRSSFSKSSCTSSIEGRTSLLVAHSSSAHSSSVHSMSEISHPSS